MLPRLPSIVRSVLAGVLVLLVFVVAGSAQETSAFPQASAMAQQNLRPYWHVFIAYAIAVLLILGWVVSIARRLASLERRLID